MLHPADEILSAGKSVLFDAVAVVLGPTEADEMAQHPAAQDFLRDAHAHCKFVALHGADPLLTSSGMADKMDEGYVELADAEDIEAFLQACRALRYWPRESGLIG